MNQPPILKVSDLKVHYPVRTNMFAKKLTVKAVDGVTFELRPGETLGLVGESGCGKSSLGRAIIRLIQPNSGTVEIDGKDFTSLQGSKLRSQRTDIQMIFQDPYASLDPRMTIEEVMKEPLRAHFKGTEAQIRDKVFRMLDWVAIPKSALYRYPHEFSGGQRQRIAIARALILEPKILIADEPVSSLDVSVQAQILNLLKDIQSQMNLAMLFISHNLAVVKYISHKVAVMYLGQVVEMGDSKAIYQNPLHPYTRALISAVSIPDPIKERSRKRVPLMGEIPSNLTPPSGCAFHTRCPFVVESCKIKPPQLIPFGGQGGDQVDEMVQLVRCPELGKSVPIRSL